MGKDIASKLQDLTPEEMAKVANLIDKFSSRHQSDSKPRQRPKKQHHKKKRRDDLVENHGPGRKQPRQRVVEREDEELDTRRSGRGRTQPRRNRRTNRKSPNQSGRRRRDQQARTEAVQLSGENKFDKMKVKNKHKSDTKIDRQLWGQNEATERRDEIEFIEFACSGCGLWFDINPDMIYTEPEGDVWYCNDCSGRR